MYLLDFISIRSLIADTIQLITYVYVCIKYMNACVVKLAVSSYFSWCLNACIILIEQNICHCHVIRVHVLNGLLILLANLMFKLLAI